MEATYAFISFYGMIAFCFLMAWLYVVASKNEIKDNETNIYQNAKYNKDHDDTAKN